MTPLIPFFSAVATAKVDRAVLLAALHRVVVENPRFSFYIDTDKIDPKYEIVIVSVASETLAEAKDLLATLRDLLQGQADIGLPKAACRETIRGYAEAEGKYIRQLGEMGQYAHVKLRLETLQPGKGFEFENAASDHQIPNEFVEPIEQGMLESTRSGVVAGCPMTDFKAVLVGGSYHSTDSSAMAFKIAASLAFKEAARKAAPVLLEPMMLLAVKVPEEYMGTILGDLNARRGRIEGIDHRDGKQLVKALVPLAEMFDYAANLNSNSQDRATFSLHYHGYQQALQPPDSGTDSTAVTANLPRKPQPRSGAATADPPHQENDR